MAAAFPSTANMKEIEENLEDVSDACNPEEYESKLSKFGNTMSNWMKLLCNKYEENFHAEWFTVSTFNLYKSTAAHRLWPTLPR